MVKASEIIQKAQTLLIDPEAVRWPLPELAGWIDSAINAILIAKPSANTHSITVGLEKGTKQKLPTDIDPRPMMFIAARRNINADGTPGKAVTPVSIQKMDMSDPDWHSERRKRPAALHYLFDEKNPTEYFVYPANDGKGKLDITVACEVAPIVPTGDPDDIKSYDVPVGLPEPYSEPIIDYVCYRAQTKDATGADAGRGALHYQAFAQAIGIKTQVEANSSPNARRTG